MRTLVNLVLITIIAFSFAVFASTVVRAFFYAPDAEIAVPEEQIIQDVGPEQYPTRLTIPALQIDAHVQHVGITKGGAMATPSNFRDVAWYRHGAVPGGRGSAVIAGHVDNGLGLSGVFKHLADVEVGDEIVVEREDGSVARFRVSGKRSYPYNEVPVDVVFNPSGSPRLNLITCEGRWLEEDKTYDQRLVVFAELIG